MPRKNLLRAKLVWKHFAGNKIQNKKRHSRPKLNQDWATGRSRKQKLQTRQKPETRTENQNPGCKPFLAAPFLPPPLTFPTRLGYPPRKSIHFDGNTFVCWLKCRFIFDVSSFLLFLSYFYLSISVLTRSQIQSSPWPRSWSKSGPFSVYK